MTESMLVNRRWAGRLHMFTSVLTDSSKACSERVYAVRADRWRIRVGEEKSGVSRLIEGVQDGISSDLHKPCIAAGYPIPGSRLFRTLSIFLAFRDFFHSCLFLLARRSQGLLLRRGQVSFPFFSLFQTRPCSWSPCGTNNSLFFVYDPPIEIF